MPLAVLRKRFLAPEWVFIFGIGRTIEPDPDPKPGITSAAMRILYVVGTRPNFVKTAPVIAALRKRAYSGWLVVEQDQALGTNDTPATVIAGQRFNLEYLRQLGG